MYTEKYLVVFGQVFVVTHENLAQIDSIQPLILS